MDEAIAANFGGRLDEESAGDRQAFCPCCDGFREFARDDDAIRCSDCGTTAEYIIEQAGE